MTQLLSQYVITKDHNACQDDSVLSKAMVALHPTTV